MIAGLLKTTAKAVAWLPAGWARALALHWGWMLARVVRLRRTYVLATLARCFPEKTEAERRAIYVENCRQQAQNLVELMRFAGGREAELGELVDVQGEEHVRSALERGRGVLILIAHYGNYDLMGLYAAKRFGYPLTIITKTLRNAELNALWWELRRKAGVNEVPAHNSYRTCVKVLKKNELVGFMLDQNRPAEQGVFVEFFGRTASTTPGLAFMSAQTGAPVVPVFMRRTAAGRHALEARPALEPPADRKEETLREHTARYTKIIEDEIRLHPEQWLWWHKRWKSRPAGETASAADA
jgi:Kdo2-lipid IVA lauroyltransferase/acyltransferase